MSQNNGKLDVEQKIWDICGILRDDGMHIGTYVEQVTVLLFLNMMDEREQFGSQSIEIPEECQWSTLKDKDGEELLEHYNRVVLPTLGDQDGIVGEIFARVNSQFRTPVNLREAIREIDDIEWSAIDVDVKGTAYEALLQRYAEEAKGAGQYFTPRPAIKAIVKAIDPDYDDKIHDPAAGTGGFLIHAFEHILEKTNEGLDLTREERRALMTENLSGMELVPETRRLGLMNLALHDLQPQNFEVGDSLSPGPHTNQTYDIILTNPPYGGNQKKKRVRDDFMVETQSPELNFIQHNMTLLNEGGECGMVVPDGVLFQSGQAKRVREHLIRNYNLHTILILPIGAFYPYTNVTTNVLIFSNTGPTEEVSFYDLRTGIEKIKKSNPLTESHFDEFLSNYDSRGECDEYFSVSIDTLADNDYSLNYKDYKEFEENDETVASPEELLTELLSLEETVRENTEEILDELEENNISKEDHPKESAIATIISRVSDQTKNVKIEDVCKEIKNGGTPKRSNESYWGGSIPWLKSGELNNSILYDSEEYMTERGLSESSAKMFSPNTVLVAMYGATRGETGFIKNEMSTNQAVCGLTANEEICEPKFLWYCLRALQHQLASQGRGGGQDNINQTTIRNSTIPLPPIAEQREIVSRLEIVEERVEELQNASERMHEITETLSTTIFGKAFFDELIKSGTKKEADEQAGLGEF